MSLKRYLKKKMNQQNPTKLNNDHVGSKNYFVERPKKASKLLYIVGFGMAFALLFAVVSFAAVETYHIAKDTQEIQTDVKKIYSILNDLELIE